MESSDEEDESEETEVGGAVTKTKHDLMLKTEVIIPSKQLQCKISVSIAPCMQCFVVSLVSP